MPGLIDRAMRFLLRRMGRRGEPSGILLVSARGPAEMVFLASVLPRFMRLAEADERVTLLIRADAGSMSFLFPRSLIVKRVEYRKLATPAYRWQWFRQLFEANYRMVVSLDWRREPETDEALVAATMAPTMAAMEPAPSAIHAMARAAARSKYTLLFDSGPARQDKIVRWVRFADFLLPLRLGPLVTLIPEARLPEAVAFEVPTVVLFPFSGIRPRQLQPGLWEDIIAALPKNWQIRIAGHQADFDRNPQFKLLLGLAHVSVDTSGFDHLASVLRGARLVIGTDTAGVHLSIVLGVPTLCLASAAYVGAGVPYDETITPANAHFLYTPIECQGCMDNCPFDPVHGMYPCVARIEAGKVLEAVGDMIARGGF